ncbi:MAG: TVP38/TMEM64 family protein [Limisphaerales bacterium]
MIQEILDVLRDSPILFMLGMGTLPLVGVPLSAFWLAAGAAFKPPWYAFTIIMGGMAINFALAYLVSNRWLRGPITRLFEKRGIKIPEAKPSEYIKLTLAIRLFPGLPNFMQSYLLGLANVPFRTYFFVSFPPQIAYAIGFVVIGESLVEMKGFKLVLGISIVVAAGLIVNMIRKRRTADAKQVEQLTSS